MNQFAIQAFFKQFPFVKGLLNELAEDAVTSARVHRIDEDVLMRRPSRERWQANHEMRDSTQSVSLLDAAGKTLFSHVARTEEDDETVGEVILRLANPDECRYLVWVDSGCWDMGDGEGITYWCNIVLYKPPKGFSLKGWILEQSRRAEAKLKAEVAEIDSEA